MEYVFGVFIYIAGILTGIGGLVFFWIFQHGLIFSAEVKDVKKSIIRDILKQLEKGKKKGKK